MDLHIDVIHSLLILQNFQIHVNHGRAKTAGNVSYWAIDFHVDVNRNMVVCTVNTVYVSIIPIVFMDFSMNARHRLTSSQVSLRRVKNMS